MDLAEIADDDLQTLVEQGPPENTQERAEYEDEMAQSGVTSSCSGYQASNIYALKLRQWFEMLDARSLEELFIPCSFPGCAIQVKHIKHDRTYFFHELCCS